MSRIGKKPITIPAGVTITSDGLTVSVTGKNGTLTMPLHQAVEVTVDGDVVTVDKKRNAKIAQAMWGTTQSHITNMITGVTEGFKKILILEGVGFRMAVKGKQLDLALGFSHPVLVDIPEGITVEIEKMNMTISGINKQVVGQFASEIRGFKPVEPYKGKGFRYSDEIVRRKEGKKATA